MGGYSRVLRLTRLSIPGLGPASRISLHPTEGKGINALQPLGGAVCGLPRDEVF